MSSGVDESSAAGAEGGGRPDQPAGEQVPAEAPSEQAPAADAPADQTPAADTPVDQTPAADAPADRTPAADAPADPTPAADAPADPTPAADTPADQTPAADASAIDAPAQDAPAQQQGEQPASGEKPAKRRKRAKREQPASGEKPANGDKPAEPGAAKKPRRRKPRERRRPVPDLPRTRAPLPLDELRDASRSTMNLFGARQALREALGILAPRERQELNVLVAADEDHRPRARNIANGSLGAGRIDKAMAATIVSMAPQEELWGQLLDKEQAAQKLGRIRQAKQRDKQRADRAAERAKRSDRVSREEMEKASDGRVGATIRFVTDEKRERRPKGPPKKGENPMLDRLGY